MIKEIGVSLVNSVGAIEFQVFYCRDCGYEWVEEESEPKSCSKCGSSDIYQDPDVLDTWFSSGLWPFSTLVGEMEDILKGEPLELEMI